MNSVPFVCISAIACALVIAVPSQQLAQCGYSVATIFETCKEGHIPLVTSLLPEVSVTIDGAPTVGIEQLSIETWQDTNDFLQI
jgi:hypothetical protein